MRCRKTIWVTLLLGVAVFCDAQKLIEYSSGMGTRAPHDGNIWVLYSGVTATHEGMTLKSDSAHYNTKENNFIAFGNVVITLSDTTFIFGNRLFYDGNSRIADIWDDTVVMVDGKTTLLANHVTYDRPQSTAFYTEWGHGLNEGRSLYSRQGQYNSQWKEFYIYQDVRLADTAAVLYTDTLVYNTVSKQAHFESPTYIYKDSTVVYSELGDYNTSSRMAISYKASYVEDKGRMLASDTLFYNEQQQFGKAYGNVFIYDSVNDIICTGRYGESHRQIGYSFVTDSAQVVYVDSGDSLYIHADTVFVVTDGDNQLKSIRAFHKVKVFRHDAQAMCDSAYYSAPDSSLSLYRNPVLWYEHYQCSADTISVVHDTAGAKTVFLRSNCFALQQVDLDKFNQLKGKQGVVYLENGEPLYADIIGSAQMVFYITEKDVSGQEALVGVNAGMGTDMRIYFNKNREPERVATYDNPDMQTFPPGQVPAEWNRLKDFKWQTSHRPRSPKDIFVW